MQVYSVLMRKPDEIEIECGVREFDVLSPDGEYITTYEEKHKATRVARWLNKQMEV